MFGKDLSRFFYKHAKKAKNAASFQPNGLIVNCEKTDVVLKQEVETLKFYLSNWRKAYPSNPKENDWSYSDYYMFSMLQVFVDPIIHILKLIVNIARFIPATLESMLGYLGVKDADKNALWKISASIILNLVNTLASFVVGITRIFANVYDGVSTYLNSDDTEFLKENEKQYSKEKVHVKNLFTIFNLEQNDDDCLMNQAYNACFGK